MLCLFLGKMLNWTKIIEIKGSGQFYCASILRWFPHHWLSWISLSHSPYRFRITLHKIPRWKALISHTLLLNLILMSLRNTSIFNPSHRNFWSQTSHQSRLEYHCKPFLSHETGLWTILLHKPFCRLNSKVCRTRACCYSSIIHHRSFLPDNRICLSRSSSHSFCNLHIDYHFSILQ